MASGNPTLNDGTFRNIEVASGPAMTISGTVSKTGILLAIVILGTTFTWNASALQMPLTIGGAIGGLIFAMVTIFKRTWSPFTAPVYALLQGLFLGGISSMYNAQMNGIVLQAVMLTFGVMAGMLFLYQARIIRVTDKLRAVIVSATVGILLVYVLTWILGFFGIAIPMIHGSGWVGIGFSLFVVTIASLNLLLDFDAIEGGVAARAPRYMEWYASFGLMVTLIWLYLEILRLLSKINRR